MTWEVYDEEFEAVLAQPAPKRCTYFLKRVAARGQLWGLHGAGGWVIAEDDDGYKHFPVWPHPRFATACAEREWKGEKAEPIDIDEWVEGWSPKMTEDGLRVSVFQTPADQGIGVSPERLKHDLEDELSHFEL
jgi:hypothetical protein